MKKVGLALRLIFILTLGCFMNSCNTEEKMIYFQDKSLNTASANLNIQEYDAIIQPGDIIKVVITSLSPEASSFFNLIPPNDLSNTAPTGYLVNSYGNIEIPLVGSVKVSGLTTIQAKEAIKSKLEKFLQQPTVQVTFENYRITILGEVLKPSVYFVNNAKISLPEALGLAGDLTIYGNRKNVLIIRDINGKKEFNYIDLTSRDFFSTPYYFLRNNDVVYIQPIKEKRVNVDTFFKIAPLIISSLTLATVILNATLR